MSSCDQTPNHSENSGWAPPPWPSQPSQPADPADGSGQPADSRFGAPPLSPPAGPRRRHRPVRTAALAGAAGLAMIVTGGLGFGLGRGSAAQPDSASTYAAGSAGSGSSGGSGGSGGSGSWGSGGYAGGRSGSAGSSRVGTGPAATNRQAIGVVTIDTKLKYEGAKAAGTGIVLTANGEVVTNNHVIEDATAIKATVVSTGKTYTAVVVGTDVKDDIAVLKLTGANGLATVQTAGAPVEVGDKVVGVGNAGGTGRLTSAAGRVIGLHQSISTRPDNWVASEHLTDMIASNADIRAGDSGGPLYNAAGKVVGIDTAGSDGTSSTAAGPRRGARSATGLAVPIAKACSIADRIESGHASARVSLGYPAFLGVEVSDADVSSYGRLGYRGAGSIRGALVGGVLAGTPAAAAGLRAGDVITKVGSERINSATKLRTALAQDKPGEAVSISWTRASAASTRTHHHATVTLMRGPAA